MNLFRSWKLLLTAALLVVLTVVEAQAEDRPLTLQTIMQDPDWIGPPVESAWWLLDGSGYIFKTKTAGSVVRELSHYNTRNGSIEKLTGADLLTIDGPDPIFNRDATLALSIVEGSLVVRELGEGATTLKRLYTGVDPVVEAQFSADGAGAYFRSNERWWHVALDGSAAVPVTNLIFEDSPEAVADDFEAEQLRLFSTLERLRGQKAQRNADRLERERLAADFGPAPWYLGDQYKPTGTHLSSDGRWLIVTVVAIADEQGKGTADKMPHYVTQSGYVEVEDVRRLVGRKGFVPEQLWLLDLQTRETHKLNLDYLSGRDADPLADLKLAQDLPLHDANNLRPIRVDGVRWHPSQPKALLQLRALDNKDQWLVRLEADSKSGEEIHRQSDEAWVNWYNTEFGWVPNSESAWVLSEQSGYLHLYTVDAGGREQAHNRGDFEFITPVFTRDGATVFGLSNRAHATEWDVFALNLRTSELRQVTQLRGVESFTLAADEQSILVRYSESYKPAQSLVVNISDGAMSAATDTRTQEYRGYQWQQPTYVAIPSSHGAELPIWSKFYPASTQFVGPRPAVLFVHGAGYTQNTHHKFPYYFREQMFHNLLTARGYHVLDMDYRASEGYGRDWRTSIYRQMGTPELEDYIDGVNWLIKEHNVDPDRVGIYGGSYGGFMTFMALFKAPDVFAAGAALRPVTDWRHYNHGYTSAILNTPQVDPEAHRRSSPIEYAEGLKGQLLISHGMLDDNVFYKDSVRIVQRLIELEKEHWELASYPLEAHGYVHPESWLDQYRRILKLFERAIGDDSH